MFSFNQLLRCALSVALTTGVAVDVVASEIMREPAASAMYGKIAADQRMIRSQRVATAAPWRRTPPPATRASERVLPRPDFARGTGRPGTN